jgi:BirA family biotin operon repressor/biotin-[acetyl-CoA-carboxylase] ligase
VRHVAETGSTNADLIAAAADGAPDRSVLVADYQTAGRGRLDRRWEAPAGTNLLVSLLFREVPSNPSELTQRVGLATVAAVASTAGVEAGLKWPNDVVVGERKLGGILAQRASDGAVVVGLGLNVRWSPDEAVDLGEVHDPLDVLAALLVHFDGLPADIGQRYRTNLTTLGRRVRVTLPSGDLVGTAIDVDAAGRLVVVDRSSVSHHVDAGDVVHVRSE